MPYLDAKSIQDNYEAPTQNRSIEYNQESPLKLPPINKNNMRTKDNVG